MLIHPTPRTGKPVIVDGQTLSIAAVAATARHGASVQLSSSHHVRRRVEQSLQAIDDKVDNGISVYGGRDILPYARTCAHNPF